MVAYDFCNIFSFMRSNSIGILNKIKSIRQTGPVRAPCYQAMVIDKPVWVTPLNDLTIDELDLLKETVDTLIIHVERLKQG